MKNGKALILIVEDNPINSTLCRSLLNKNGYATEVCNDGESALVFLSTNSPDLILLDIIMPGIDGFEFCESLKIHPRHKDTPVIFLSAMDDEASIIKGFNSGGVDYITKPFRTQELLARTKTHVELKRAKEKLIKMATTDELTRLANRRYFMERFNSEFDRVKRYESKFSLLMIDIDHFKNINDTFGHKAGDKALQEAATIMKKSLRSSDIIGRVGGEEFSVLLPETDINSALYIAERLRNKVEKSTIDHEDVKISITISIGTTQSDAGDHSVDDIIIRADKAMYNAKNEGRNKISSL
ncbi:MAG TPA: diguanylate cyclase [Spirochaetota bacterium]|nr:diguanylate cyclase [Spirochaetota bacterium]HPJ33443.1 diguanylate cyclase [Spirochaetota bacterium]